MPVSIGESDAGNPGARCTRGPKELDMSGFAPAVDYDLLVTAYGYDQYAPSSRRCGLCGAQH